MKIPPNALTAAGMVTPYYISSSNGDDCDQTNPNNQAFVEITIVDKVTGKLFIYRPVVVNLGTTPYFPPTPIVGMPASFTAGIWFGSNAGILTLVDGANGADLAAANCVNGDVNPFSPFGQYAYCNAVNFFTTTRQVINQGLLVVPTVQLAIDGLNCPTVRDFMVVDMDQSDNVITSYIIFGGKIAQDTPANSKFSFIVNFFYPAGPIGWDDKPY